MAETVFQLAVESTLIPKPEYEKLLEYAGSHRDFYTTVPDVRFTNYTESLQTMERFVTDAISAMESRSYDPGQISVATQKFVCENTELWPRREILHRDVLKFMEETYRVPEQAKQIHDRLLAEHTNRADMIRYMFTKYMEQYMNHVSSEMGYLCEYIGGNVPEPIVEGVLTEFHGYYMAEDLASAIANIPGMIIKMIKKMMNALTHSLSEAGKMFANRILQDNRINEEAIQSIYNLYVAKGRTNDQPQIAYPDPEQINNLRKSYAAGFQAFEEQMIKAINDKDFRMVDQGVVRMIQNFRVVTTNRILPRNASYQEFRRAVLSIANNVLLMDSFFICLKHIDDAITSAYGATPEAIEKSLKEGHITQIGRQEKLNRNIVYAKKLADNPKGKKVKNTNASVDMEEDWLGDSSDEFENIEEESLPDFMYMEENGNRRHSGRNSDPPKGSDPNGSDPPRQVFNARTKQSDSTNSGSSGSGNNNTDQPKKDTRTTKQVMADTKHALKISGAKTLESMAEAIPDILNDILQQILDLFLNFGINKISSALMGESVIPTFEEEQPAPAAQPAASAPSGGQQSPASDNQQQGTEEIPDLNEIGVNPETGEMNSDVTNIGFLEKMIDKLHLRELKDKIFELFVNGFRIFFGKKDNGQGNPDQNANPNGSDDANDQPQQPNQAQNNSEQPAAGSTPENSQSVKVRPTQKTNSSLEEDPLDAVIRMFEEDPPGTAQTGGSDAGASAEGTSGEQPKGGFFSKWIRAGIDTVKGGAALAKDAIAVNVIKGKYTKIKGALDDAQNKQTWGRSLIVIVTTVCGKGSLTRSYGKIRGYIDQGDWDGFKDAALSGKDKDLHDDLMKVAIAVAAIGGIMLVQMGVLKNPLDAIRRTAGNFQSGKIPPPQRLATNIANTKATVPPILTNLWNNADAAIKNLWNFVNGWLYGGQQIPGTNQKTVGIGEMIRQELASLAPIVNLQGVLDGLESLTNPDTNPGQKQQ